MSINKKGFLKISILTLVFLCLITAWLAFGKRGFIHLYRMEKERQTYLEKIRKLELANQELIDEISRLQTESDYIEKMARNELGMIRDNEIIFRFNSDQSEKAGH